MAANSETDKDANKTIIPVITNEMMTDGPEYFAAACPLNTNIPAPEKMIQNS